MGGEGKGCKRGVGGKGNGLVRVVDRKKTCPDVGRIDITLTSPIGDPLPYEIIHNYVI